MGQFLQAVEINVISLVILICHFTVREGKDSPSSAKEDRDRIGKVREFWPPLLDQTAIRSDCHTVSAIR